MPSKELIGSIDSISTFVAELLKNPVKVYAQKSQVLVPAHCVCQKFKTNILEIVVNKHIVKC